MIFAVFLVSWWCWGLWRWRQRRGQGLLGLGAWLQLWLGAPWAGLSPGASDLGLEMAEEAVGAVVLVQGLLQLWAGLQVWLL